MGDLSTLGLSHRWNRRPPPVYSRQAQGHPFSRDLVGRWLHNEGSGSTTCDISGNNKHGTLVGAPTWVDSTVGTALWFDGSSDYISIPTASEDIFDFTEFTLSAWIRWGNGSETYETIISKRNGATYAFQLRIFGTNLSLLTSGGSLDGSALTADVWTHVAATFSGSTIALYKNGKLDTSSSGYSVTNNAVPLEIGRQNNGAQYYKGGISDVRVYRRALRAEEIAQIYIDPYQDILPRRIWVPVGALAGAATPIGLSTEADTAFPIGAIKTRSVGLSTETATAFSVAPLRTTAINLASEADTAFAVDGLKTAAVGLSSETDTAFAATPMRATAVGLSIETDTAFAVDKLKTASVGLSSETDTALSVTVGAGVVVGLAAEADTALAVGRLKVASVGLSAETDTAFSMVPLRSRAVGLSTETDTAQAITYYRAVVVGLAAEADVAFAATPLRAVSVGLAVETDTALGLISAVVPQPGSVTLGDTGASITLSTSGHTATLQ